MRAWPVTIHDVAAAAGVSPATAASGARRLRIRQRGGARRVAAGGATLGYVPNAVARALSRPASLRRSGSSSATSRTRSSPRAARGLADVSSARLHRAARELRRGRGARAGRAVEALRARAGRRARRRPQLGLDLAAPRGVAARGAPVVLLDRTVRGLAVDAVTVDNARRRARAPSEHLLEHGHRRIGIVTDEPVIAELAERLRGYRAALDGRRPSERLELVSLGGSSRAEGYRAARPCSSGSIRARRRSSPPTTS